MNKILRTQIHLILSFRHYTLYHPLLITSQHILMNQDLEEALDIEFLLFGCKVILEHSTTISFLHHILALLLQLFHMPSAHHLLNLISALCLILVWLKNLLFIRSPFNIQSGIDAINKELHALIENQTWIITDLPQGKKLIGCRWIFKVKLMEL